jgi:hypothetical protein
MTPLLYEVNTRCWLGELSAAARLPITLANVPDSEIAGWKRLGFTRIWLMGVWTTGPRSRAEALNPQQRQHYVEALPDCREEDIVGSAYAIADYQVAAALGGEEGLRQFRSRLREQGLSLVLDFVPNHLGLDHPWLHKRPELFVQSSFCQPGTFLQETVSGQRWLAHGKDPYFPSWTDTVQLDYRLPATRAAMTELLVSVAARCDGVRCDMAMLLLSDIFAKTWAHLPIPASQPSAGNPPEFWSTAIASVRRDYPDFIFLAEAYWGTETRLQSLGFDYTYDKALYDKLVVRDGRGVQQHLQALWNQRSEVRGQRSEIRDQRSEHSALESGAHFLENHDEPRIASLLSFPEHRAAALLILGLPGLRFLHEGQLSGARRRVPVQLRRRASEPAQPEIEKMYRQILSALPATAVGHGDGRLLDPRPAWSDNPTAGNIILVQWQSDQSSFDLVAINLAPHWSQCYAPLTARGLSAHDWSMKDLLGAEQYVRPGRELQSQGLYLDLAPQAAQLFHFQPA